MSQQQVPFIIPDAELTTEVVHAAFEVFVRSLQTLDGTSLCLAFERVVCAVRHPYVAALRAFRADTGESLADKKPVQGDTNAFLADRKTMPSDTKTFLVERRAMRAEKRADFAKGMAVLATNHSFAQQLALRRTEVRGKVKVAKWQAGSAEEAPLGETPVPTGSPTTRAQKGDCLAEWEPEAKLGEKGLFDEKKTLAKSKAARVKKIANFSEWQAASAEKELLALNTALARGEATRAKRGDWLAEWEADPESAENKPLPKKTILGKRHAMRGKNKANSDK